MDQAAVKRAKVAWAVVWGGVTAAALLRWGVAAAAVVAVGFAGMSLLAVVGGFLFVLLQDAPVPARVLVIAVFLGGTLVELGAMVAAADYVTGGAVGRALGCAAWL